jgi:uncharacterized protein YhhL (DUF1145 family)
MKGVKKELKDIAFETGLTIHEVEVIVRSQFKMALNEMQSPTMNPIRLMYFGVFGVKPYRKIKMEENLKRKSNKN